MDLRVPVYLLLLTLSLSQPILAGDWPQILGPQRSGVAEKEELADIWPRTGPKKLWEASVGSGYSGVAVAGKTLIVFHRLKEEDTVAALDAESGKEIWSRGTPTTYRPQIEDSDGPRCVPVIHGDRVITFGAQGVLSARNLKTGEPLWSHKTHADFKPPDSYFGAGSTPLVEGNLVLVNVGGRKDAGIVAFHLQTGKVEWRSTDAGASYSSPIAVTSQGARHALFVTRLHLISLDPLTGKERFRTAFGKTGTTVNAANPVMIGDDVFLTASYGIGSKLVRLGKDSAQTHWEGDEILSSQYATPIVHAGKVYAVDGRQDFGPVTLKCFDPESLETHWSKPLTNYATLIAADGKLLVQQTDGLLRLVTLTPEAYQEIVSAPVFDSQTRALPALAHGRYYLRDRTTLRCFELR